MHTTSRAAGPHPQISDSTPHQQKTPNTQGTHVRCQSLLPPYSIAAHSDDSDALAPEKMHTFERKTAAPRQPPTDLVLPALIAGAILALTGCGPPSAADYGGRWKPVNRFAATSQSIPITPDYIYFVSPLDTTLTHLLSRWARDSSRQLHYGLPDDFTLHFPTAAIRTTNIQDAVDALNKAYSQMGVFIEIEPGRITAIATTSRPNAN